MPDDLKRLLMEIERGLVTPVDRIRDTPSDTQWCIVQARVDPSRIPRGGAGLGILLDKSAFQQLGREEHDVLRDHFRLCLPPILVWEVLADLSKPRGDDRPATTSVAVLADKLDGTGPPLHEEYSRLCINSLLGWTVPLNGQMALAGSRLVRDSRGMVGMIVEPTPVNEGILRWATGVFTEDEQGLAVLWRRAAKNMDLERWMQWLNAERMALPSAVSMDEVNRNALRLLSTERLQPAWLDWLIRICGPDEAQTARIKERWESVESPRLSGFAPFALHCLRVNLMALLAIRDGFVGKKPTNILDLEYLCYLPFCNVFASSDKLHIVLAPFLVRPDQRFVLGGDLKRSLSSLAAYYRERSPTEMEMLRFALGPRPPPMVDSLLHDLYHQLFGSRWRPGGGNLATSLDIGPRQTAMGWVAQMYREACGDEYFAAENGEKNASVSGTP